VREKERVREKVRGESERNRPHVGAVDKNRSRRVHLLPNREERRKWVNRGREGKEEGWMGGWMDGRKDERTEGRKVEE
jgi:hypothetical protein